jgi:hypothetical protein
MRTWAFFLPAVLLVAGLLGAVETPPHCTTSAGLAPACTTPAAAQHPGQCGCPQGANCRGNCSQCRPPCPGDEEREPETSPGLREVGAFVAPPRFGTMRGPSVRRGWEGCAITFPELRLKFPSIEWPSAYTTRTQAHMQVGEAIAPWESHGYVAANNRELAARQNGSPESAPQCSAAELARKESAAAQDYAQKLAEYQQLLEKCERQQAELRDCIRQCLEQHPGNAKSPGRESYQSPRQAPQQTPYQAPTQAPHGMPYGPKPVVDPRVQALPPPNFAEQPAAYLADPPQNSQPFMPQQHAPQHQNPQPYAPQSYAPQYHVPQQFVPQAVVPRPIVSPHFAPRPLAPPQAVSHQQHVIREPAAPAGRITGFVPGR